MVKLKAGKLYKINGGGSYGLHSDKYLQSFIKIIVISKTSECFVLLSLARKVTPTSSVIKILFADGSGGFLYVDDSFLEIVNE